MPQLKTSIFCCASMRPETVENEPSPRPARVIGAQSADLHMNTRRSVGLPSAYRVQLATVPNRTATQADATEPGRTQPMSKAAESESGPSPKKTGLMNLSIDHLQETLRYLDATAPNALYNLSQTCSFFRHAIEDDPLLSYDKSKVIVVNRAVRYFPQALREPGKYPETAKMLASKFSHLPHEAQQHLIDSSAHRDQNTRVAASLALLSAKEHLGKPVLDRMVDNLIEGLKYGWGYVVLRPMIEHLELTNPKQREFIIQEAFKTIGFSPLLTIVEILAKKMAAERAPDFGDLLDRSIAIDDPLLQAGALAGTCCVASSMTQEQLERLVDSIAIVADSGAKATALQRLCAAAEKLKTTNDRHGVQLLERTVAEVLALDDREKSIGLYGLGGVMAHLSESCPGQVGQRERVMEAVIEEQRELLETLAGVAQSMEYLAPYHEAIIRAMEQLPAHAAKCNLLQALIPQALPDQDHQRRLVLAILDFDLSTASRNHKTLQTLIEQPELASEHCNAIFASIAAESNETLRKYKMAALAKRLPPIDEDSTHANASKSTETHPVTARLADPRMRMDVIEGSLQMAHDIPYSGALGALISVFERLSTFEQNDVIDVLLDQRRQLTFMDAVAMGKKFDGLARDQQDRLMSCALDNANPPAVVDFDLLKGLCAGINPLDARSNKLISALASVAYDEGIAAALSPLLSRPLTTRRLSRNE